MNKVNTIVITLVVVFTVYLIQCKKDVTSINDSSLLAEGDMNSERGAGGPGRQPRPERQ